MNMYDIISAIPFPDFPEAFTMAADESAAVDKCVQGFEPCPGTLIIDTYGVQGIRFTMVEKIGGLLLIFICMNIQHGNVAVGQGRDPMAFNK